MIICFVLFFALIGFYYGNFLGWLWGWDGNWFFCLDDVLIVTVMQSWIPRDPPWAFWVRSQSGYWLIHDCGSIRMARITYDRLLTGSLKSTDLSCRPWRGSLTISLAQPMVIVIRGGMFCPSLPSSFCSAQSVWWLQFLSCFSPVDWILLWIMKIPLKRSMMIRGWPKTWSWCHALWLVLPAMPSTRSAMHPTHWLRCAGSPMVICLLPRLPDDWVP